MCLIQLETAITALIEYDDKSEAFYWKRSKPPDGQDLYRREFFLSRIWVLRLQNASNEWHDCDYTWWHFQRDCCFSRIWVVCHSMQCNWVWAKLMMDWTHYDALHQDGKCSSAQMLEQHWKWSSAQMFGQLSAHIHQHSWLNN